MIAFVICSSLAGLSLLYIAARGLRRDKLGRPRDAAVVRWWP